MNYSFFNEWAAIFMDRLIADFSLSVEDAASIIGNAGHESGGFKSLQEIKPLVPGSRGGYGIMQWTGPRRREYEAYCKRNKLNPADMDTNYKFLFVELKGPEGRVLPKLRAAKGLDAKVEVFSGGFLRPGIPHMDSRKVWARRALAAYEAKKPAPKPAIPTTPGTVVVIVPDAKPEPRNRLLAWLIDFIVAIFGRKSK